MNRCKYSDAETCSAHGEAQSDGSCICGAGYVGSSCKYSDAETCSGHGTAQPDGSCICDASHWTSDCSVACTPGFCDGECDGHGKLQSNDNCKCEQGWLPSEQAFVEHAERTCGRENEEYQSGISTVEACKKACANDADCKYATVYQDWTGSSYVKTCYFSSECTLSPKGAGGKTVYVSFCSH